MTWTSSSKASRTRSSVSTASALPSAATAPRLKVAENHRFLVTQDDEPFFWLGDTAWELFHRLDREEADRYLQDRAAKGFTVIQAVAPSKRSAMSRAISRAFSRWPDMP